MSKVTNIILAGVGGQGTILASKILAEGVISIGLDVKMSEVHGMAQRGGSVTTQVRFGEEVSSPIIGKGQADILVSFEEMETGRWLEFVKPDGLVVINEYRIESAPILSGAADYPEGAIDEIRSKIKNTQVIQAAKLAEEEIGNAKTMNVILVGALAKGMGLEGVDWDAILAKTVKPDFLEINKKAFKLGYDAVKN